MSRAIKFRAWNKLAQKMAVIDALDFVLDSYRAHAGELSGSGHLADIDLMQFTGLLDKTGNEIYEGDVMAWKEAEDAVGIVMWEPEVSGFMILNRAAGSGWVLHDQWEVIGNIYENKERE